MRKYNDLDMVILLSWLDKQPRTGKITIGSPTFGPLCGFVPENPTTPPVQYTLDERFFNPYE